MNAIRQNLDSILVFGFAALIFLLTGLNWDGLREFSSVVSVVCLMLLLWRIIGDFKKMTPLSLLLSASLSLNLATGAAAQYLLTHSPGGGVAPPNTFGICLVLASRFFVLFIVVTWNHWIISPRRWRA